MKQKQNLKYSAKIRRYELKYRMWLKALFKAFGKFTLEQVAIAIEQDSSLSPEIVDYFFQKINFDPITKTFTGVLEQNEKFYDSLLTKSLYESTKGKKKTSFEKFVESVLPQDLLRKSLSVSDIQDKQKNFFELEQSVIKSEFIDTYTKRKNQLDEFRQSYLFNTPEKVENFEKKYPEPTYNFAHTTGRTQVNNLNRDLSATIATNMGAEKFEWLTSQDERVRETHRHLNHKIFKYSDMPIEYNDYNCRCTLLPVLSTIPGLEGLDL